jgi:hypothetical protein
MLLIFHLVGINIYCGADLILLDPSAYYTHRMRQSLGSPIADQGKIEQKFWLMISQPHQLYRVHIK